MSRKPKSAAKGKGLSIRQQAYLHIQRKIASGELSAGGAISELDLAREMGSSRTPIREAIGQLTAEGFLEQSPSGGALVVQLTREDIVDLYELREALETYAIGKVARLGIRPADQERLQTMVDEILVLRREIEGGQQTELNAEQMNRFISCDFGFHAMLIGMAQNARIHKVVNETRLLMRIFSIHRQGHDAAALTRIHKQHQDLLNAVAKRDADRAVKIVAEHVQHSQQERLEEFDLWKREASIRQSIPAFFDLYDSLNQR
jgi:DNA-binding GntR family transcriptional regulator